jgi:hypothetical protein
VLAARQNYSKIMRFESRLNVKRNIQIISLCSCLIILSIIALPIISKHPRLDYLGEGAIFILLITISYFFINLKQFLKKIRSQKLVIDSEGLSSPKFRQVQWKNIEWYAIFQDRVIFSDRTQTIYIILFDDFEKPKNDILISTSYFTNLNNIQFRVTYD